METFLILNILVMLASANAIAEGEPATAAPSGASDSADSSMKPSKRLKKSYQKSESTDDVFWQATSEGSINCVKYKKPQEGASMSDSAPTDQDLIRLSPLNEACLGASITSGTDGSPWWVQDDKGRSSCYFIRQAGGKVVALSAGEENSKECRKAMPKVTGYQIKTVGNTEHCYRVDDQTQGSIYRQEVALDEWDCKKLKNMSAQGCGRSEVSVRLYKWADNMRDFMLKHPLIP